MRNVLFLVIALSTFSVGCATVFKGGSQTVTITSEPTGAEVVIDGNSFGKTPLSVNLKKNKYSSIILKKEGYSSQVRALQKSYDPVALINVFWDLSTTDLISGAAYEYEPSSYHFQLEREATTAKN